MRACARLCTRTDAWFSTSPSSWYSRLRLGLNTIMDQPLVHMVQLQYKNIDQDPYEKIDMF